MLLFIASEIMLFGVVLHGLLLRPGRQRATRGRRERFQLPVFVAGVNTAILVTSSFTMHWALQSIKRGNRAGPAGGARADAS